MLFLLLFYQRDDLGKYILYAGLTAPVFFTSTTMFGILNGINKQGIILRNSLIVAALELVGLYVFTSIPSINIYGYVITLFFTSLVSLVINLYEVKKHIELKLSLANVIIFTLLAVLTFLILRTIIRKFFLPLNFASTIFIILLTFGIFVFWGTFGEFEE